MAYRFGTCYPDFSDSFEGEFCEVREYRILGSCTDPCSPSYLPSSCNSAGLINQLLLWKGDTRSVVEEKAVASDRGCPDADNDAVRRFWAGLRERPSATLRRGRARSAG